MDESDDERLKPAGLPLRMGTGVDRTLSTACTNGFMHQRLHAPTASCTNGFMHQRLHAPTASCTNGFMHSGNNPLHVHPAWRVPGSKR